VALDIVIEQSNVSCFGAADGMAWARVDGGLPLYSFEWFNSDSESISTNISARGLVAGEYRVIITDSVGLTGSDTTNITQLNPEEPLSFGMTPCQLLCFLKLSACRVGNLSYKYFVEYPDLGIECEQKQKEIEWVINAIDTLRCWKRNGTEVTCGSITYEIEDTCPTEENVGIIVEKIKEALATCDKKLTNDSVLAY
jgi:hypothetical protein